VDIECDKIYGNTTECGPVGVAPAGACFVYSVKCQIVCYFKYSVPMCPISCEHILHDYAQRVYKDRGIEICYYAHL